MIEWKSTKNGDFPEPDEYVLGLYEGENWIGDGRKIYGKHCARVVQFIKGRKAEDIGNTIRFGDQHGNNAVPYAWDIFGPGKHFGQDIVFWSRIDLPEEFAAKEEDAQKRRREGDRMHAERLGIANAFRAAFFKEAE